MAIILKVKPEQLTSVANDFKDKNKSIQKQANDMLNLVKGINADVWSGTAATAYKNKFNSLQNDITKVSQKLENKTNDLIEIASNYNKTENENQNSANSLSSSVVS